MKQLVRRVVASAVALTAMLTVNTAIAGTANASPADAMARCQRGLAANFTTNTPVAQSPGIFGYRDQIWPGDVIQVVASGGIKTDGWPWTPYFSPDGTNDMALGPYWPAEGRKKMSLVGIWNDVAVDYSSPPPRTNTVQLGSNTGCIQYTGAVNTFLWLEINDDYKLDNAGSWNVVVRHFWA